MRRMFIAIATDWCSRLGCALGLGLSYAYNESILWGIFHFAFGWAYVAYKLALIYLVKG